MYRTALQPLALTTPRCFESEDSFSAIVSTEDTEHMSSYSRTNLNSVHLIPTAAVWQGWKLILASCAAGVVGIGGILFLNGLNIALDNSVLRSEKTRTRVLFFETCLATWELEGKPRHKGRTYCNAAAVQYVNSLPLN